MQDFYEEFERETREKEFEKPSSHWMRLDENYSVNIKINFIVSRGEKCVPSYGLCTSNYSMETPANWNF